MQEINTYLLQTLAKANLGEKESIIYLNLLKLGSSSASNLASLTRIKRSTVFFILDQLITKKIVSKKKKNNVTSFYPMDPSILMFSLNEKARDVQNAISELKTFLPYLNSFSSDDSVIPEIIQYEGEESFYKVIDLQVSKDLPIYFISTHKLHPKYENYLEEVYIPKRKAMKCKCEMIVYQEKDIELYIEKSKGVYSSIYEITKKDLSFFLTMCLYDDSVIFMNSLENITTTTAIVIKNHLIYQSMLAVFDGLKTNAKCIYEL